MSKTLAISPHIVEGLYREALALSEDVRARFSLSGQLEARPQSGARTGENAAHERVRIAYSRTGLRTTTRMMHAIAWLLNHRAFFMSEISATQLRRHGHLALDLLDTPDAAEAELSEPTRDLVERTEAFYDRLLRLDERWNLSQSDRPSPSAIQRLRKRIESRIAS